MYRSVKSGVCNINMKNESNIGNVIAMPGNENINGHCESSIRCSQLKMKWPLRMQLKAVESYHESNGQLAEGYIISAIDSGIVKAYPSWRGWLHLTMWRGENNEISAESFGCQLSGYQPGGGVAGPVAAKLLANGGRNNENMTYLLFSSGSNGSYHQRRRWQKNSAK